MCYQMNIALNNWIINISSTVAYFLSCHCPEGRLKMWLNIWMLSTNLNYMTHTCHRWQCWGAICSLNCYLLHDKKSHNEHLCCEPSSITEFLLYLSFLSPVFVREEFSTSEVGTISRIEEEIHLMFSEMCCIPEHSYELIHFTRNLSTLLFSKFP